MSYMPYKGIRSYRRLKYRRCLFLYLAALQQHATLLSDGTKDFAEPCCSSWSRHFCYSCLRMCPRAFCRTARPITLLSLSNTNPHSMDHLSLYSCHLRPHESTHCSIVVFINTRQEIYWLAFCAWEVNRKKTLAWGTFTPKAQMLAGRLEQASIKISLPSHSQWDVINLFTHRHYAEPSGTFDLRPGIILPITVVTYSEENTFPMWDPPRWCAFNAPPPSTY